MTCHICNQPLSARYLNTTAGEECVDPCHWPYMAAWEIAKASQIRDEINFVACRAGTFDVHESGQTRLTVAGEQVSLLPTPDGLIPASDGPTLASPALEPLHAWRIRCGCGETTVNGCGARNRSDCGLHRV